MTSFAEIGILTLSDKIVGVRFWQQQDAQFKAEWGTDPEIVKWTGVPADYTAQQASDWLAVAKQEQADNKSMNLAIVDASSGLILGACDIRRPNSKDPDLGEIGYLLAKHARGKGIASRALFLMISVCFPLLEMQRIQALVHPDNQPSAAVLERLGFQCEGLLKNYRTTANGQEDRLMFSLMPDQLIDPSKAFVV